MKSLILAISFFSTVSFAANMTVEPGLYSAIDVDTQSIVASLEMKADKTVIFKVKTPDFTMPEPGCKGVYDIQENLLSADMRCPLSFLSQVQVVIDITNVTPAAVRLPKGVIVEVVIDALGEEAYKFVLKKIETTPIKN